ncbi:MAG TPA: type II toxin-antitoxin system VapC family toxin [Candidatus Baltobacteraceae bacterium]|nr:type II toxin-antitoxin system VapC family toxin [Candidatus Baltobacteraceae bacterium]
MSRVFWDTNLFIYLFEQYGGLSKDVFALRERMIARGDQLFASTLTLGEVLVKPIEKGNEQLKRSYSDALTQTATLLPFDRDTAVHYATIRKDRSVKAPDAIQLACAAQARIDLFITNDDHLKNKVIPGIHFIVPLKSAIL